MSLEWRPNGFVEGWFDAASDGLMLSVGPRVGGGFDWSVRTRRTDLQSGEAPTLETAKAEAERFAVLVRGRRIVD